MLEYPEAQTIARQLNETCRGRRIERFEALHDPHGFAFLTPNDPETMSGMMCGKRMNIAHGYGGRVVVDADDMRLTLNDGINLRYHAPGDDRPTKHQLLIELDDDAALSATISMYGFIGCQHEDDATDSYHNAAVEKPAPLSDAFDYAYFTAICDACKPTLSVKALLATEQRIPGLGNGVLQDILFNARLHPKRKLASLSADDRKTLFDCVKRTLLAMTAGGGRDVEKDLFGVAGGYKTLLSNKTLKHPCPVCGGALVRQAYLGGNVYFCPTCQPL